MASNANSRKVRSTAHSLCSLINARYLLKQFSLIWVISLSPCEGCKFSISKYKLYILKRKVIIMSFRWDVLMDIMHQIIEMMLPYLGPM